MKLKEVQLLGVLALIAGAIIVLSLWSGRKLEDSSAPPEGQQAASSREEVDPSNVADMMRMRDAEDQLQNTFTAGGAAAPAAASRELEIGRQVEEAEPQNIAMRTPVGVLDNLITQGSATAAGRMHEVQRGEKLEDISKKYYGTKTKWQIILDANKSVVSSPTALKPGMKLVIPGIEAPAVAAAPAAAATSAAAAQPGEAAEAAPGSRTHVVKKGDTLAVISRKYYGTTMKWRAILEANKGILPDERSLKPGMTLVIPPVPGVAVTATGTETAAERPALSASVPVAAAAAASAPAAGAAAAGPREYEVQRGDSLWLISKKVYGNANKWRQILEANRNVLQNADDLKPGMRLAIP